MDWIIELDICALLITSLILLVILRRKELPTMKNITFFILMVLTFLASLFDLVSVYAIEHVHTLPLGLNYFLQMMYAIPFTAIPMVYYIYVMSMTIQNRIISKGRIAFIATIYGIELFFILTTPFTHWHFYFNEAMEYSHGWAVYVTYGLSFFFIFLCKFWNKFIKCGCDKNKHTHNNDNTNHTDNHIFNVVNKVHWLKHKSH